jgi:hypothetical protein
MLTPGQVVQVKGWQRECTVRSIAPNGDVWVHDGQKFRAVSPDRIVGGEGPVVVPSPPTDD